MKVQKKASSETEPAFFCILNAQLFELPEVF